MLIRCSMLLENTLAVSCQPKGRYRMPRASKWGKCCRNLPWKSCMHRRTVVRGCVMGGSPTVIPSQPSIGVLQSCWAVQRSCHTHAPGGGGCCTCQSREDLADHRVSARAQRRGSSMYSTVSSSLMYSVHRLACSTYTHLLI